MIKWKRTEDTPADEPTEEQIWEIIEAHDPHYRASIRDRLFWHQEMIEERNIYGDIFSRSPRMPKYDAELPSGHEPTDWIKELTLRHSHDPPLKTMVDHLVYGTQEILQPAADEVSPPDVIRLLGYHILHRKTENWKSNSVFGTPLRPIKGYTEWARFHLQNHHRILKKAGVYQAIYASLFDYGNLPFSWIRGVAEQWDRETNTCWLGPHELTITLGDLRDISGLPIFGTPYEECIPPDHELFQRQEAKEQRKGKFVYPVSLHRALDHYKQMFKVKAGCNRNREAVTLDSWSTSFLQKSMCSTTYARLSDPFDIGYEISRSSHHEIFEPRGQINSRRYLMPGIDEETSLVAFIATWLCYFVFPFANRVFRPSTLLMASLIAQGEKIALAPATLAYLYKGLGEVSAVTDKRRYNVEAPWHYLHGWIHTHVSGAFGRAVIPPYFEEQYYPWIMQLNMATVSVNASQIRTFMFAPLRMTDRYEIIHRSKLQNMRAQRKTQYFTDSRTEKNIPLLLSDPSLQNVIEYFIGIRPAWLSFRRNESITIEAYNPNRVARQFGFTQATPLSGLPQIPNIGCIKSPEDVPAIIRLQTVAATWAHLFRLGTGSHFRIAPQEAKTGVSHLRLQWIRHTFSSFLEMGFNVYGKRLKDSVPKGSSEGRDKYKRQREHTPINEDHSSSSRSGQKQKRSKDTSTSVPRNLNISTPNPQRLIRQEPCIAETVIVERSKNLQEINNTGATTAEHRPNALPYVNPRPNQTEDLPRSEESEQNFTARYSLSNYINESSNSQHQEITSAPILELLSLLIPVDQSVAKPQIEETLFKSPEEINAVSPTYHPKQHDNDHTAKAQNVITNVRELFATNAVNMANSQLECCQEAVGTSMPIMPSSPVQIDQPMAELEEHETLPDTSGEASAASSVHYASQSALEQIIGKQDVTTEKGEFATSSTINITEMKKHTLSVPENTLETSSEVAISEFVSRIQTKTAKAHGGHYSQSIVFIKAALQGLIADINPEALPELSNFCDPANSLLDSAVTVGIGAQDLQYWESELRKIEYAIHSIQTAQVEKAWEENKAAEATYENIVKEATPMREKLEEKRKNLQEYKDKCIQAEMKAANLMTELEELERKKQQLIHEKELVDQEIVVVNEECDIMKSQVIELEQMTEPLSQQLEAASQQLRVTQYQHEYKVAQANAARTIIKETQAKYL